MTPLPSLEAGVLAFSLTMTRVTGFVATFPLFGQGRIPRQVKIGLAVALSAMWLGTTQQSAITSEAIQRLSESNWLGLTIATVQEALIGAILGFAFSLFLTPLRVAGAYIGQEMGLTFAAMASPTSSESSNVVSQLIESLGVLLLFSLNVHYLFFTAIDISFQRWPIAGKLDSIPLPQLLGGISQTYDAGLLMSAPIGICLFVVMIALSLLTRAVPQLNLFSIGLTVRVAAGIVAMLLFLPEIMLMTERIYNNMSTFAYQLLAY